MGIRNFIESLGDKATPDAKAWRVGYRAGLHGERKSCPSHYNAVCKEAYNEGYGYGADYRRTHGKP